MRIIAKRTLDNYGKEKSNSSASLKAWHDETKKASWKSPNDVTRQFPRASILSEKRVVFNIGGNNFRLIVEINYRKGIVFIAWFGTHAEYDKIDAKGIGYNKAN